LTNLTVIPGAKEALDFPEAFQSEAPVHSLGTVKSQYDIAFYDSPAINHYEDAQILSSLMDGVLLVDRNKIKLSLPRTRLTPEEER
jgi:MinD-like ATPase involved in chromosome partitioning or flagellar assembly